MAIMLLAGSLISRRSRVGSTLTMMVAWATIFTAGFVVFSFRDDLGYVAQRLRSEATGEPVQIGQTLRIPMALDGHFWVEAEVNGVPVKFLIDSGATMTTVGAATAAETRLRALEGRGQLVRTGNGVIRVGRARADTIALEGVERRDMTVFVAGNDDINVLGMNWLSSLQRWGVEGRWLILEA
ncbi:MULTISPECIES: retropepsin-like aspartic protease family protein [Sphingomonas]|uniref:retropepsin-like aspartic protease family protein n=1 Tax=Sphingomonas TaxID=13687 RepID=UPI0013B3B21E|nr:MULTISPECIES: TIGR02281 family clan AA aspartic protease [Sphingomonas]